MFPKSLAILAAASSALATVFVTSPVASTTFRGGEPAQITWRESLTPTPPSLQEFGNAMVSIYVGNAQQQTLLQSITQSVNVATTSTIQFTPDPNIGPDSSDYFVRFEALQTRDPGNPSFPALAFSAKFTLANMRGTFNDTVRAQIAGQSTAPLAGQPTSAPPTASRPSTPSGLTTSSSRAPTSSASRSSAAASASNTSGALTVKAGWFGVILSALVGATVF